MLNQNFIFLGLGIQILGGISYLIDTLKGKVKPNKVSWLLWSIAPLIAFSAQIKQGVGFEALSTFIVGFLPLIVFIASFLNKEAKWKIGKLDIVCGALSLLGLGLWALTRVGNIAIAFSIMADFLACIPTAVKAWHEPETENHWAFSTGVINTGIALLIITNWQFQNYAFPAYLTVVNGIIAALIIFKLGKRTKLFNNF